LQAYKAQLQTSVVNSRFVSTPVPTGLLAFQDAIGKLTRPLAASTSESDLFKGLRVKYSGKEDGKVAYLWLTDAQAVYQECLKGLDEPANEKSFQLYLDFLHLQGVLTHDNAAELKDLVVIDRMWLLKTLTRVIRNPDLHPLPGDLRLPKAGKTSLFQQGGLSCCTYRSLCSCSMLGIGPM
jgi:hypothetical protein